MYGAIDFYQAAKKGIKPIIGCEVYVAPGSRDKEKKTQRRARCLPSPGAAGPDEAGYRNLIKLVTAAHLEGFYYKPRIDKELLAQHSRRPDRLSGCLASEIPKLILKPTNSPKAREANRLVQANPRAGELLPRTPEPRHPEQAKVNRHLIPWAEGVRPQARRHQRRPLRRARTLAGPRLPDLHRHPGAARATPSGCGISRGAVLPPLGRGNEGPVSPKSPKP
jgi:DNA polymerase III subunit alpha